MQNLNSKYDYFFEGKSCELLKQACLQIISQVQAVSYIEDYDFRVVVSRRDSGDLGATMRYMNSYYMQWINYLSEKSGGTEIEPYVLTVYPRYFRQDKKERLRILIHELKHINPSKQGCTPHTGFGDEDTVKLVEEANPELLDVV